MAIGDPVTQPIPAVSTLGTGYATQINAFLAEVKTRLEAKVTFADLSASSALNLLGKPLQNAQYVGFSEQSVAPSGAPIGRIEYYNGEFYMVTPAGVVQITSGGVLDVTSAGGIGGDYGAGNPAEARFDNANTRYDFYDDFGGGIWAYVRGRGFDIANGATSTNRVRLQSAAAASYALSVPVALPGANRSVMVLDSTGQIEDNDTTNRITNDVVLGTSGEKIRHGQYTIKYPLSMSAVWDTSISLVTASTPMGVTANGGVGTSTTFRVHLRGFQNHWRIKSIQLDYRGIPAGTRSVRLYYMDSGTLPWSQVFPEAAATGTGTGNSNIVQTLATPITGASQVSGLGVQLVILDTDTAYQLRIVYDTDY